MPARSTQDRGVACAKQERVLLNDGLARDDPRGAWFKEEVRRELVARFGLARVYQGGLKVYTTIDLGMQEAADDVAARALAEIEKRRARSASAVSPTMTRRCRRRCSRWTPPPARCARWSAAATSPRAASIAPRRRIVSRARPSSRSSTRRRSSRAGLRPRIIDRLDEPMQTLQGAWMPEDEHLDAPEMTLRTALRTSSNRAAVQAAAGGRHRQDGGDARTPGRRVRCRACRRWRSAPARSRSRASPRPMPPSPRRASITRRS